MTDDRRAELLHRIHELRQTPLLAVFLDVAMTCRLSNEALSECIQEVLEARARAEERDVNLAAAKVTRYDPRD